MSTPDSPVSPRPLININRSSSRETTSGHLSPRQSLDPSSPGTSPYGSPVDKSPLRSAMKHARVSPSLEDATRNSYSLHDGVEAGLKNGEEARGRSELPSSSLSSPVAGSAGAGSMYSRRVGFDTFTAGESLEGLPGQTGGGTGVNFAFTVSAKSSGFCRTKQSRTFLVGTDLNEYSVHALDWALTSLTEDNDELVVLRVIDPSEKTKPGGLAEAKAEAEQVLEKVMKKNGDDHQISIVVEFAIGPVEETIHRMIEIYKPDSLIVGTRGLPDSIWKSAYMGSISRYCVAKSPVPVVVVRPEDKVRESLSRRAQDPSRRSFVSLLSPEAQSDLSLARTSTNPSRENSRDRAQTKEEKNDKKGREFKKFGTFS